MKYHSGNSVVVHRVINVISHVILVIHTHFQVKVKDKIVPAFNQVPHHEVTYIA